MGKAQLIAVLVVVTVLILLFIAGAVLFIMQYRKRKVLHQAEKMQIEEKHQLDILHTRLESQQQTMQFIGQEIHDNVGQKLTLASIYSKQLESGNSTDEGTKLNAISKIIDESLSDLRQLSKSLTDPGQADAGIKRLLDDEAARINSSGVCTLAVKAEGDIHLSPAQKNILFRLLQEFIQNSLKHSGCTKINIHLRMADGRLIADASDDGKGFDTSAASGGIGLQNMQRRAGQLQAQCSLGSEAGKGTFLHIQIPLTV